MGPHPFVHAGLSVGVHGKSRLDGDGPFDGFHHELCVPGYPVLGAKLLRSDFKGPSRAASRKLNSDWMNAISPG